jgi:hypothetical protein
LTLAGGRAVQFAFARHRETIKESRMKMRTITLALLLVPSLALGQKTSYDFDRTANFVNFKTYALRDGTKVGDKLIDDRIDAALEAELAKKGLTRAEQPDLFVTYHIAFDNRKDITAFSAGGGPYGWRWGAGWGTTNVRVDEILVGTLVVDAVDAAKNEVVWRGVGEKEVNPRATPDRRDRNINEAVQKVLRNFPPSQKK